MNRSLPCLVLHRWDRKLQFCILVQLEATIPGERRGRKKKSQNCTETKLSVNQPAVGASLLLMEGHLTQDNGTSRDLAQTGMITRNTIPQVSVGLFFFSISEHVLVNSQKLLLENAGYEDRFVLGS